MDPTTASRAARLHTVKQARQGARHKHPDPRSTSHVTPPLVTCDAPWSDCAHFSFGPRRSSAIAARWHDHTIESRARLAIANEKRKPQALTLPQRWPAGLPAKLTDADTHISLPDLCCVAGWCLGARLKDAGFRAKQGKKGRADESAPKRDT
ncbi:hypothetical protein IQ06DRAFT_151934 [Phaeosphaeriaceae sp. SRC1lsM3a]|nr:hypothetical protein IQ06DRAFT_151934 [Stagonospora sp. SRC1lsM3a]